MENIFHPNQRLVILQGLQRDPAYSLSNEMLQRLLKSYGHTVTLSDVNTQLTWLEKRGYLTTERLENGLVIAKLQNPGFEIATGTMRVDGIDAPRPE